MRLLTLHFLALLPLGVACAVDPPPTQSNETTERPVRHGADEPPSTIRSATVSPRGPAGSTDPVSVQELAQRLRQVGAILNAMKEKAREAAALERTECEKSFASVTAAIEASQQATATLGRRPPRWSVAPRPQYLRLCETLPVPVQRCSRYDYRADHADECAPLMDGLPGEQAAVLDRLYHRDRS